MKRHLIVTAAAALLLGSFAIVQASEEVVTVPNNVASGPGPDGRSGPSRPYWGGQPWHHGLVEGAHFWRGPGHNRGHGRFLQDLEQDENYKEQVKEIRDVQRLLFIESQVLDAMVANSNYSADDVRRQAGIVASLYDQVRDKTQSLSDNFDNDRPRRGPHFGR